MFCGECGTENSGTGRFCRNCGKPLRLQPAVQNPAGPADPPGVASSQPAGTSLPTRKRSWRWVGIVSLITGILSWVFLTIPLGGLAVILGIAALFLVKKNAGKIAISAIAGIVLALGAYAVSYVIV